jgi:5-methyltetrahydropteroyltriglutamate--homocysteine methyltransferase
MDYVPPLAVTVIGSWARPAWYSLYCEDVARHPEIYGDDDREETLRDAVRLAIDDQVRAGATIITDGEMRRGEQFGTVYDRLTGLERQIPTRRLGPPTLDQHARYLCTAPITAPQGLGILDEYKRLSELTKAPTKITVPGPLSLASRLLGGKVYRDQDAIVEALVPIVNRELRALAEADAQVVQVDEWALATRPESVDSFVRLIERTTAGARTFVSLHLCFGNDRGRPFGPRSYRPLIPKLDGVAVKQLALEFANREMAEVELLADIKAPMNVAVGLVDVKNSWVESPELVADRLRTVLKYIEPTRVQVSPDCGFAHTARSVACAKLANLAAGAAIVRKERGL